MSFFRRSLLLGLFLSLLTAGCAGDRAASDDSRQNGGFYGGISGGGSWP